MFIFLQNWRSYPRAVLTAPMVALLVAVGAPAKAEDRIQMRYDVHAFGMKVYKINLDMKIGEKSYTTNVAIRAKGFVKFFANAKVDMTARGTVGKRNVAPTNFVMKSNSKGKKRHITISWSGKKPPKVNRNYEIASYREREVARVIKPTVTNPLTHIIRHAAQGAKKSCSGTDWVYTGKVIYAYKFEKAGTKTFTKKDPGSYRGPAIACRLKMSPVAGLSNKKKKEWSEDPGQPYTIWYAPVAGGNGTRLVPVAASGVMHEREFLLVMKEGAISGKPINSRIAALN